MKIHTVCAYKEVREKIHALKYKKDVAGILPHLIRLISHLPPAVVIIPIPSSPFRTWKYGFDHMELLCKEMRKVGVCISPVLKRKWNLWSMWKPEQKNKNRRERLQTKQKLYVDTKHLDYTKQYILFDDVITTGSTLREACECLQTYGVTISHAYTIAG